MNQTDHKLVECKICGTMTVVGLKKDCNGEIEEGLHLCVQHLFEKVIFPEEIDEGHRFTSKKAVGEALL